MRPELTGVVPSAEDGSTPPDSHPEDVPRAETGKKRSAAAAVMGVILGAFALSFTAVLIARLVLHEQPAWPIHTLMLCAALGVCVSLAALVLSAVSLHRGSGSASLARMGLSLNIAALCALCFLFGLCAAVSSGLAGPLVEASPNSLHAALSTPDGFIKEVLL